MAISLKQLILESELTGMTRKDLEKLEKVKQSSANTKDFLRKARNIGLGVAAAALLTVGGKYTGDAIKKTVAPMMQKAPGEPHDITFQLQLQKGRTIYGWTISRQTTEPTLVVVKDYPYKLRPEQRLNVPVIDRNETTEINGSTVQVYEFNPNAK